MLRRRNGEHFADHRSKREHDLMGASLKFDVEQGRPDRSWTARWRLPVLRSAAGRDPCISLSGW